MRTWPDRNGSAIGRFLRQRRLRHPQTPSFYRRILRGFQDVVKRCEPSSSLVSRRTLEVWLRERAAAWSASTVLHRACIIDRVQDPAAGRKRHSSTSRIPGSEAARWSAAGS